ncbi:MAG: hypothetical protein WCK65_01635 [Rhodospirillaceae bacterium]
MDISMDPGAALILRQGADQNKISLGAIKRQARADADIVNMAIDTVKSTPVDASRGTAINTSV